MKSFIRSANLRALLLKEGCPEAIKNCNKIFHKMTKPHKRSAALVDLSSVLSMADHSDDEMDDIDDIDNIDNSPSTPWDTASHGKAAASTLDTICSHSSSKKRMPTIARTLQFYSLNGRTFSKLTRHVGNSSVLVQSPISSTWNPAHIVEIMQTTTGDVLFEVRYLAPPVTSDPFAQYPTLDISLWAGMQDVTVIITPTDVISQFASIPYPTDVEGAHFAVINLSPVSLTTMQFSPVLTTLLSVMIN